MAMRRSAGNGRHLSAAIDMQNCLTIRQARPGRTLPQGEKMRTNLQSSNLKAKCLGITAALLLAASLASAQVVTVNPVAGNSTASGTNLRNALAGITDATSAKPYVIWVSPGVYDLGNTGLVMKPYVDIEGSGQQSTIVRGNGNNTGNTTAVLTGAFPAELRNLEVVSVGQGFTNSIPVLLNQNATSLRDVTLVSSNATTTWGIRCVSADPTIQNVNIVVIGGTTSYGIAVTGTGGLAPTIRRAVINLSGAVTGYGIHAAQSALPVIRDADIFVSGGTASGIAYTGTLATAPLEVTNTKIFATSTTGTGVGIDLSTNQVVVVTHSNIVGSSIGLRNSSGQSFVGTFEVDHCDIKGSTNSVSAPLQSVLIGASKLDGPVSIGAPTCAASFNGNYVPLSGSCS